MTEFADHDAIVIRVGEIAQGIRDAVEHKETPHSEAFYQMAALTMAHLYRRAVKGS